MIFIFTSVLVLGPFLWDKGISFPFPEATSKIPLNAPGGTGTSISDGTVKWDYLGVDEGPNYFVYFNSEANRTSVIGNRFSTFPAGGPVNGWIYIDPSAQDIDEHENIYNGNDPTWQPAHAYSLGDRVSSDNAVYVEGGVAVKKDMSVYGNTLITGNLTVTGYTTYTNTSTVLIADNIITVNAAIDQSAQPSVNAGIEVDRGAQPNAQFIWVETAGKWSANNGNNSFYIASESAETYANAAFIQANTGITYSLSAGVYANGAFTTANTASVNALSAGAYANAAFAAANTALAEPNALAFAIALG